jgi:predicted DNA-binding transcriptional regulator AlpA
MVRQVALPPTLAPRLIGREAAAAYVCVSPNTFDRMVDDGRMPHARRLGERRIAWDVRELDIAVDRLPAETVDDPGDETWSDVDAPQASAIR